MNLPLVKGVGGCSARMDKWRKHILWNIPLAPFTRGRTKNHCFTIFSKSASILVFFSKSQRVRLRNW